MSKTVVYIAGPYRDEDKIKVVYNIVKAADVAAKIRRLGFVAVVMHLESMYGDDALDDQGWLDHGIELMSRCDAVLDIRRGEKSSGTELECTKARLLGIPVFETIRDLIYWDNENEKL